MILLFLCLLILVIIPHFIIILYYKAKIRWYKSEILNKNEALNLAYKAIDRYHDKEYGLDNLNN